MLPGALDTLKPAPVGEILSHIDDLLAEARHLRERITAALHHEREPLYVERRWHQEPHQPDRRRKL